MALCVVAAVTYAIAVVAQKPALAHASALQVTTFGCVIGAVVCLPFAGQLIEQAGTAPLSATLNLLYLGVFPTALARTTAGKLGATTYLVPAMVVLMAWVVLGEVPGWLTLAGGMLCLVGVAVARRQPS
ncbi:DMT family transporter [Streptosporangium sp. NPDC005286]|uniref:DMT family transporter n=1 Tax=Streptosporangium sp. NPDC005286 TaxID=3154463 RepID=UPI0033B609D1